MHIILCVNYLKDGVATLRAIPRSSVPLAAIETLKTTDDTSYVLVIEIPTTNREEPFYGVPWGIRTPVTSVKGRCPGPG